MQNNYIYCANENTCIHRKACKRYLGNYSEDEAKDLPIENLFIDESKCIPNYSDVDCENSFNFLDRFRLSNGKEFRKDLI